MATKRELMLAGFAAKGARMLASDNPHVVVPNAGGQAGAVPLEVNFAVLAGGAAGAGVRLPPASGQFLHFLFNANPYTVGVYAYENENINDQLPGQAFLLGALMAGVFAPARQQWIGGQVSGTAQGPVSISGPLGVGQQFAGGDPLPPAGADPNEVFAGRLVQAGTDFAFNWYYDAAGNQRYLTAGYRAASISHDVGPTGSITIWSAPPAVNADDPIDPTIWQDLVAFSPAGPLTPNQTCLYLMYMDNTATIQFQQVLLGAALGAPANGMPAGARVLYVVP